ncbi:copper resistance protein CopC, partial [Gryllotalpicola sp.]|uniref:copper resistance protein CopC n=1 Tax=Gryllotalpicola sp. TaxID=1932787 RepID=UPI002639A765
TGTAAVDGLDVRQAVDITTDGTFTINYRIVADDGHPVSTAIDTEWPPIVFTVKLASVAPGVPGRSSAAPSSLSGTSTPSTTSTPSASTGDAVGVASHAPGTFVGIGLGGAAVIVAAIITIVVIRRNRRH